MKKLIKDNKLKIIVSIIIILFLVFLIVEIKKYNTIPEHIHSIDDKTAEQRSDMENITVLERTLQKEPNNVNVMIELTGLYIKTDNKKSAKKMIKEILDIDPTNKEAIELLKKSE